MTLAPAVKRRLFRRPTTTNLLLLGGAVLAVGIILGVRKVVQMNHAAAAAAILGGAMPVLGADTEVRDFAIHIDGKRAGDYHMTVQRHDDGSTTMIGQANLKVSYLIKSYIYTYWGTETWKDGRLQHLDSQTSDDGKKFQVSAAAEPDGLHIKSGTAERVVRPDIWISTYWHQPDARFCNQPVPLIEADTGKDINATLQYVGTNDLTIGGQAQTCRHYRVTGGVTVDVWYDAQERLVRQESIEEGKHRVVLELAAIRR